MRGAARSAARPARRSGPLGAPGPPGGAGAARRESVRTRTSVRAGQRPAGDHGGAARPGCPRARPPRRADLVQAAGARYSQSPIAVGSSAEAVNSTVPPSTLRTSRTWRWAASPQPRRPRPAPPAVPTSSRRAPPASAAQTIRPSARSGRAPRARCPASAGRCPRAAPSSRRSPGPRRAAASPAGRGSAPRSAGRRPSQLTVTRYGNAAPSRCPPRPAPSRPASSSETSALGVPAAGIGHGGGRAVRVRRVGDVPALDRGLVDPGHQQAGPVRRPPVAAHPAHLLGRDELGQAVGEPRGARRVGQRGVLARSSRSR